MEIVLTPQLAPKVHGGTGGTYYAWCDSELPMLRQGNIGASKLALQKNGFSLPAYSDSSKVAYVLQGMSSFCSGFSRLTLMGFFLIYVIITHKYLLMMIYILITNRCVL